VADGRACVTLTVENLKAMKKEDRGDGKVVLELRTKCRNSSHYTQPLTVKEVGGRKVVTGVGRGGKNVSGSPACV